MGKDFYSELGEGAPELMHLFGRPRALQATLFIQRLGELVKLAHDPKLLFVSVRRLSVGHVKYGARPEDARAFATAFLAVAERLLADRWSPR